MTSIPPISLLAAWPTEKQADFINSLPHVSFTPGEIIFMKDDPSIDVYFILQGSVKSTNYDQHDGKISYFRTRTAGDCFGFYGSICGQSRLATMVAIDHVVCAKMNGHAFFDFVLENPAVGRSFIRLIMTLLRTETDRITNITLLPASKRLVAELLHLHQQTEGDVIRLPARNDFASYLNMTRETLARELSNLKQQGLISINGTKIKVVDVQGLRNFLDSLA